MNINIGTAIITGLTKPFYYFEHRCWYAWDIMFKDPSTLMFNNLPYIKLGESEEQAKFKHAQILRNFKEAHIHEGESVAVIFRNDGFVVAIGKLGQNVWIDCLDNFCPKPFRGLYHRVSGLSVY